MGEDAVAWTTVALEAAALSDRSQEAVEQIRALDAPAEILVSGNTARFMDEKDSLLSHAPLVVALIVLLTIVLIFLLTGSVLLPVKTLLMNALTLAAVLGLLVIVFQHGFGARLLDYPGPYSVEVTSLVFLFAVTFALATDYAAIVRALLVPALMRLLGEANWWAPRPLRRLQERFGLREG